MNAADAPTRAGVEQSAPRAERAARLATLALCLLIAAALGFDRARLVWTSGAFFEPDDAMRAMQLRDFLAGQPWFDLTAHRLDPPAGLAMHWSRLVDLPLAGLDLFFRLFLDADAAERATRLAFPFALLAALLSLAGWLAGIVATNATRLPAIWLTLLSGAVFSQFAPGRIDHHAPQIVTLTAATGFLLQGLNPQRAPRLAAAAALMTLSVAIGLENLPFLAVMIATPALAFIRDGRGARTQLMWFAAGLGVAVPLLYVATVSSALYATSFCDAFSAPQLAAFLVVGGAFLALAAAAPRLLSLPARVGAVALAGAATLASVALTGPQCLGDPLGGVDPLLRALWLAHVDEARPLLTLAPGVIAATAAPVALGLAAALLFAARGSGQARRRWQALGALIAVGFAGGLWQVRVFDSVTPLAMIPLAAAVVAVAEHVTHRLTGKLRAGVVAALAGSVSPTAIALALPTAAQPDGAACLTPAAMAPLKGMAPARIAAAIELGSHVLAQTPHSVFAAPYHRDNQGNRFVVDAFLARPEDAAARLRAGGAGLLLWCAAQKKPSVLAKAAPDGLAAALERGEPPGWLEQRSPAGAPLLVFAVRPAQD